MKKILMAILLIALLFVVGGCDYASLQAAFTENIYTSMEPNDNPKLNDLGTVSDYSDEDLEDKADELLDSDPDDRFFEDVADLSDEGVEVLVSALKIKLETEVSAAVPGFIPIPDSNLSLAKQLSDFIDALPEDSPDADGLVANAAVQGAALFQTDIVLAASGADKAVSNLNTVIGGLVSDPDSMDMSNPGSIIKSIINPEDPDAEDGEAPSAADVAAMLTGFVQAADSLALYGATLDYDPAALDSDSGVEPPEEDNTLLGESREELATQALLTGITGILVKAATDDDSSDPAAAEAAAITKLSAAMVASPESPYVYTPKPTVEDPNPAELTVTDPSEAISAAIGDNLFGTKMVEAIDEDGNPILDEYGEPEMEEVSEDIFDVIDPGLLSVVGTGLGDLIGLFM